MQCVTVPEPEPDPEPPRWNSPDGRGLVTPKTVWLHGTSHLLILVRDSIGAVASFAMRIETMLPWAAMVGKAAPKSSPLRHDRP
jgi:hypothetical protein